jgi:hypothetical protein
MRRCLSEAKKAMQPSAMFAATCFKGEANYTGEEWGYQDHSSSGLIYGSPGRGAGLGVQASGLAAATRPELGGICDPQRGKRRGGFDRHLQIH